MFDTLIIEAPIGPDPDRVSQFVAAATANQESFETPPVATSLERLDPRWLAKKKNRPK
jgi:hypothetical protein